MTDQIKGERLEALRDGPMKVTIWKNHSSNGPYLSATPAKTYEKDGELHDGNTYYTTDLLRLSELARLAYHRMKELRTVLSRQEADEE